MAKKFFPKLTQDEVFVQTKPDGSGFNCPMLPVSAMQDMESCSEALKKAETVEEIDAVKVQMRAIAETVIPEEYRANLARFDIPSLTDLLAYLMYGDGDDLPRESASKKN